MIDDRDAPTEQAQVSRVLAARPPAAVRPEFAARVAARVARESGWFGLADWRWLSLRLAPVAALLLLAAGIVIERQTEQSMTPGSLSTVVQTWAAGGSESTPVTSVLWQQQSSDDEALLMLLAAPPDGTIVRQANE